MSTRINQVGQFSHSPSWLAAIQHLTPKKANWKNELATKNFGFHFKGWISQNARIKTERVRWATAPHPRWCHRLLTLVIPQPYEVLACKADVCHLGDAALLLGSLSISQKKCPSRELKSIVLKPEHPAQRAGTELQWHTVVSDVLIR